MANKPIEIDLNEVQRLAGLGLSQSEIAASLDISVDTLSRRKKEFAEFADALKRGKAKAKSEIANKLFTEAKNGNITAIIWIEKTRFGFSEKLQIEDVSDAEKSTAKERLANALARLVGK
jgi:transposase